MIHACLPSTISEKTIYSVYECAFFKVSKGAKIRNQYNQVPHLTQDINGKVTNSQLDTTNESQEVSPFPACNLLNLCVLKLRYNHFLPFLTKLKKAEFQEPWNTNDKMEFNHFHGL